MNFTCMVRGLMLIMIVSPSVHACCQTAYDPDALAKNTIYIEAWGNGIYPSLNYDRCWRTGGTKMSMGFGFSYFPIDSDEPHPLLFTVPVQWNWFHGGSSSVEHGAGLTYSNGTWYIRDGTGTLFSQAIHLVIKPIGYRLQYEDGGFFLRGFVQAFVKLSEFNDVWKEYNEDQQKRTDPSISPWFGISLGYTFKHASR